MYSFKEVFLELPLPPKVKKSAFILEAVKKNWKEVIGEKFFSLVKPVFFEEDTLIVEVPDYYYLQVFNLNGYILLEKVKKKLPEELRSFLKVIKFKINKNAGVKKKKKSYLEKRLPVEKAWEKELFEICKKLEDSELKKGFENLFKSYLKAKSRKA